MSFLNSVPPWLNGTIWPPTKQAWGNIRISAKMQVVGLGMLGLCGGVGVTFNGNGWVLILVHFGRHLERILMALNCRLIAYDIFDNISPGQTCYFHSYGNCSQLLWRWASIGQSFLSPDRSRYVYNNVPLSQLHLCLVHKPPSSN